MDEGVGILWKHRSSCNSKFRINSWILQSHAIMLIFQNKLFGYQSPPHWICHCPCIAAFQTTERMQNPTLWQHGNWRGKRRLSYTILTSHAWALISMTCVVRFVSTCFQLFTSIDKVLTGDQRSHILAMSSFTLQTLLGLCLHRRCLRTRPMSGSCGGRTLGSEKVFDSKLVNKWKIIRNNSNNETYPVPKHMTRIHWVHPARASCLLPSPGLKCHPCHIIASIISSVPSWDVRSLRSVWGEEPSPTQKQLQLLWLCRHGVITVCYICLISCFNCAHTCPIRQPTCARRAWNVTVAERKKKNKTT